MNIRMLSPRFALLTTLFICPLASMAQQAASATVQGLTTPPGLAATLWAAEPMVINPTNIDIDARGRVWYLEAVNYRRKLKGQPDIRPGGDRIVILEDTDGDGKADSRKVFDESPALRSPLGIAVLGDKVYVSQSPDLIVYTKDAQDRVVKREVLLTGWGGVDHDHGLHAVTFGHDGRLYFNSGDQGFDLTDKEGKHWASNQKGPYYAGTLTRMNMDGTGFSVLAHNFRNPYELAPDSFGNLWQSDNDDDGNLDGAAVVLDVEADVARDRARERDLVDPLRRGEREGRNQQGNRGCSANYFPHWSWRTVNSSSFRFWFTLKSFTSSSVRWPVRGSETTMFLKRLAPPKSVRSLLMKRFTSSPALLK